MNAAKKTPGLAADLPRGNLKSRALLIVFRDGKRKVIRPAKSDARNIPFHFQIAVHGSDQHFKSPRKTTIVAFFEFGTVQGQGALVIQIVELVLQRIKCDAIKPMPLNQQILIVCTISQTLVTSCGQLNVQGVLRSQGIVIDSNDPFHLSFVSAYQCIPVNICAGNVLAVLGVEAHWLSA